MRDDFLVVYRRGKSNTIFEYLICLSHFHEYSLISNAKNIVFRDIMQSLINWNFIFANLSPQNEAKTKNRELTIIKPKITLIFIFRKCS
jgi:hypothetical protein